MIYGDGEDEDEMIYGQGEAFDDALVDQMMDDIYGTI